jgi:hypothetical protein
MRCPTPEDRTAAWERLFGDPSSDWYEKGAVVDGVATFHDKKVGLRRRPTLERSRRLSRPTGETGPGGT